MQLGEALSNLTQPWRHPWYKQEVDKATGPLQMPSSQNTSVISPALQMQVSHIYVISFPLEIFFLEHNFFERNSEWSSYLS